MGGDIYRKVINCKKSTISYQKDKWLPFSWTTPVKSLPEECGWFSVETVIPLSWKQNSTLRIDKPQGLPLDMQRKYMTIGT